MNGRHPGCRPARVHDGGFTLVEILLAVSILGIAGAVVLGGMMTSITVSTMGRSQSEAQLELSAYADAVYAATYVNCATSYSTPYAPPSGYTATMAVTYWNGTSAFNSTCSPDRGLQKVRLTIASTDGLASESLSIAKRAP